MSALPTGTVTFVFTDIETSTRLGRELGTERWHELLSQHGTIMHDAAGRHHGVQVRTEGDAFFLVFRTAHDAVGNVRVALTVCAASLNDPTRRRAGRPWADQLESGSVLWRIRAASAASSS